MTLLSCNISDFVRGDHIMKFVLLMISLYSWPDVSKCTE